MKKFEKFTKFLVCCLAGVMMVAGLAIHPGCAMDEEARAGRKCKKRSDCGSCEVCGHSTSAKHLICLPCSLVSQICVKRECYPYGSNP